MRLNRFLASAGLGSRRSVEQLILAGNVRINGRIVTDLATQVLPTDAVKVGSRLLHSERPLYAVLHKPAGYICSAEDELGRKTIFDLLPPNWPRTHHVGRLDKESEGLIIVTNDGDLTNFLTHPRHEVEKEYEAVIDRTFDIADGAKMLRGFHIRTGRAKCEAVEMLRPGLLRLVLKQGLNRQIRLMLYELGYEVERLVRVRFGPVRIQTVEPGTWRMLTPKEIAELHAGSSQPAKPRPSRPFRPPRPVRKHGPPSARK